MNEKELLSGKCPRCMAELQIPRGLAEFSCLYCGARLTPETLVREEILTMDEDEVKAAAAALTRCVLDYPEYNRKITSAEFVPAFESYESACSPIYARLDRALGDPERIKLAAETFLDEMERSWITASRWSRKNCESGRFSDDKIIVAIFLVPMIRRLGLAHSEEFCQTLQERWVARFPKSPFYLGDYDSIAGGFRKKFLGLCFITTAVCEQAGLPDDCQQLTAFRAFRDGYLSACPDGPALIREYYNIAPGIVSCINACEDREKAYGALRRDYLSPCYQALQEGRNADCKRIYTQMVRDLEKKYLS